MGENIGTHDGSLRVTLVHELPDFADLIALVARNEGLDPGLVEKDYWILHGLRGLQPGGFLFELEGGTSLSKGFKLINRFSEDIDLLIHPPGDLSVDSTASQTSRPGTCLIAANGDNLVP
jgi:hypothetical protein